MLSRFIKSLIAAAIMGWAVFDMSENIAFAAVAAAVPLGLGMTNFMPFAAVALPMLALIAAIAGRFWGDLGLDLATIQAKAGTVRDMVVATLPSRND
jgi:hypothetical protein